MARVIGIDPGTVSFDLCGLEDDRVFLDRSLTAAEVTAEPESLVRLVTDAAPLDLVAGPSGYGLPLVPIQNLAARDLLLAYLLGGFPKAVLFSGGPASLAGSPEAEAQELGRRTDSAGRDARTAFLEAVVKAVAAEVAVVPGVREILLSGRLAKVEWVASGLAEALSGFPPVRTVGWLTRVAKEAAQGAALLADGLAGGRRQGLVEAMDLRRASGTALDYLAVVGAGRIRQELERRAQGS